jgi:hypothetical protein
MFHSLSLSRFTGGKLPRHRPLYRYFFFIENGTI